ncbi:endonuclease/exonuclease/phosphatase family protein [Streptomyces sp. NPDC002018]|uniref:endonuclease/exonuclease/phosphatase family protein n=1 Tax=Streptomyces sp. NPDC002018 TaxID=3364629 RepID=UPI00368F42A4
MSATRPPASRPGTEAEPGPGTADGSSSMTPPVPGTAPEAPAAPEAGRERPRWSRPARAMVALALLWACYTVLQRLLSGRWWVMLVPDLMPPVVFLLVPVVLAGTAVAAGAWRSRARTGRPSRTPSYPPSGTPSRTRPGGPRRTAVVLVCCLAVFSAAVSWPRNGVRLSALTHGASATAAGDLRIVSWNTTWWGQDVDTDRFWAVLKAQRADVYLLQEYLHGIDHRQENLRPVDDLARIRSEFPGYHVVSRGELITLSRYPVTGSKLVGPGAAVADRPDAPWLEVYRAVKTLRVDIRVGDRPLTLYNVHIPVQIDPGPHLLSPSVLGMLQDRQRSRRAQFAGLEDEVREQRERGAALVVAGDFNSSPAMGELSELRGTLRDAADSGGGVYPRTWNELVPVLGLWRLDWAFTTGRVTVDRYRLDRMDGLSDHRAQILEVSL